MRTIGTESLANVRKVQVLRDLLAKGVNEAHLISGIRLTDRDSKGSLLVPRDYTAC